MDTDSPSLRVHSLQTLGCVDGPGLRLVVFTQGCPLACSYCHNPDTRSGRGGEALELAAFTHRLQRSRPYFGKRGGVTFSGGEPLAQAQSLIPFLQHCRDAGVHVALDTAGVSMSAAVIEAVALADLVILDIKHASDDGFRELTGGSLQRTLTFFDHCVATAKPLWIRQVMVPGITMFAEQVSALGDILLAHQRPAVIERVELLPFHRMADHKYEEMGLPLPLPGVENADPALVQQMANHLADRGLPVPQAMDRGPISPAAVTPARSC